MYARALWRRTNDDVKAELVTSAEMRRHGGRGGGRCLHFVTELGGQVVDATAFLFHVTLVVCDALREVSLSRHVLRERREM